MGASYYTNPLTFIIQFLFDTYLLILMLRFIFQYTRADFYNPISQFIVKATNPILLPMRRFIPSWGRMDTSLFVLMMGLKMIELLIIYSMHGGSISIYGALILAVAHLIDLVFNIFIFAIFIQVILSWVSPGTYGPVNLLLINLTQPLLGPAQRNIPPIGGLDLSPIVVLLILQVAKMFILPPLYMISGVSIIL